MSLNYSVSVKGGHVDTSYKFTKREMISSLAAGNYTLCITVDGQPDYRQCLDVVISKPADLGAYLIVNNTLRQATLTLSGSETYAITLNGRIFTTSERTVTLPLTDDVNTLQVSTDKACQGTFKKTIMLSKELIYPNPFSDKVSIQLKENAGELVYVEVRDMKGLVLFNYQYKNENGTISVSLPGLAAATYLLKVRTGISESVYKIIKQ
jgi:hypothetical protein